MVNPWKEISLSDYEKHMSLDTVMQLQMLNRIMKEQFETYPISTAVVLGVAGGNGLEHVDPGKYRKVYGVDINADYLQAVGNRFPALGGILDCLQMDLTREYASLPTAELIIANLVIEYIGYDVFKRIGKQVRPGFISCVIQINTDTETWVSDSPYIHAFDRLDEIHYQMKEQELTKAMDEIGYSRIRTSEKILPNGKSLLRLDYGRFDLA